MRSGKKAGAIIRVSTTRQLEGTSPEKQYERIVALANEQGYDLQEDNIWRLAESGNLRDREGFQEALKAAEQGEIERVYVFNIDRLGRNLLEMLLFLRDLDDLGIDCWSAEKLQQLRGDDFIFQIEGAVASKERQEIIKRTQDGLVRAIKSGKYCGGIIAYGYRLNPETKQLEIEENEAKVIRQIFKWCSEEKISCVTIADRLNAMNILTRYQIDGRSIRRHGKHEPEKTAGIWRAGRVRNILRNPAYYGFWEWGKRSKKHKNMTKIKGYCPQIISENLFQKVSEVLVKNQLFNPGSNHRNYLLKGLIKCEVCGRTFCGSYSRVGTGHLQEKAYYRCNGKTQWRKLGIKRCQSINLKASEIEDVVWEDIKAFCRNPQVAIEQIRSQYKPIDENVDEKIEETNKQIRDLKRQETNILKIASTSVEVNIETLDNVLSENRKSLNSLMSYKTALEKEKIKAITIDDDLNDITLKLSSLKNRIDHASFDERRMAVLALVKKITVIPELFNGKLTPVVTITYRFNEPPQLLSLPAVVKDHTLAHVGITATQSNLVPARRHSSPPTRSAFRARCWIVLTSMCRYRAWIMTS